MLAVVGDYILVLIAVDRVISRSAVHHFLCHLHVAKGETPLGHYHGVAAIVAEDVVYPALSEAAIDQVGTVSTESGVIALVGVGEGHRATQLRPTPHDGVAIGAAYDPVGSLAALHLV